MDKCNSVSTIIMDLSKVLDTRKHGLLIAKLEAYDFSVKYLSYVHSYLKKRLRMTNVNCDLSLGKKISQEFLRNLLLVHFYSIHILMAFSSLSMRHF